MLLFCLNLEHTDVSEHPLFDASCSKRKASLHKGNLSKSAVVIEL